MLDANWMGKGRYRISKKPKGAILPCKVARINFCCSIPGFSSLQGLSSSGISLECGLQSHFGVSNECDYKPACGGRDPPMIGDSVLTTIMVQTLRSSV